MSSIKDQDIRTQALVFYEDDIQAIEAIMDAFLKKSAARCALLVDQDGHMITTRGKTENVDLDTISALVAGSAPSVPPASATEYSLLACFVMTRLLTALIAALLPLCSSSGPARVTV